MKDMNYCVCISRNEPYDRSREGWLIHRFCGLVIACDIFTQGIAKHPATAVNVGFLTCDRHTEAKYLRIWKTEFPAKSGFYWVRKLVYRDPDLSGIGGPEVVDVTGSTGFYRAGSDVSIRKNEIASAEFYGPLEPPDSQHPALIT